MAIDRSDTYNKVIKVIAEKLKIKKDTMNNTATFQDLGADSLDMVEIIMKFEEDFGIEINDEDAEKLTNIDQVVDYIHALRKK